MGHAEARQHSPNEGGQMLTFGLGKETFGVDILRVKEIRGWSPVTALPHSPSHVLGVLNLRGTIVPIIDLRRRFELESAEFSAKTVIIVLSLQTAEGPRDCGIVVDRVSDVVDIGASDIKSPPATHGGLHPQFIEGLATTPDGMLILLNLNDLITSDLQGSLQTPDIEANERAG